MDVPRDIEVRIAKKRLFFSDTFPNMIGMLWTMMQYQNISEKRTSKIQREGNCLVLRHFQNPNQKPKWHPSDESSVRTLKEHQ